jgi:hypothetical protein
LLHHVEALVTVVRSRALDPLDRFLLQGLAAEEAAPIPGSVTPLDFMNRLNKRLHLGVPLLHQALRALSAEGLVELEINGACVLTALGRQALAHGQYPRADPERRVFYFVEDGVGEASSAPAPHFLYLNGHAGVHWPGDAAWGFDVGILRSCVQQAPDWKRQHSFPQDVHELLDLPASTPAPAWQRVVVDRPERLPVLLALTGSPEDRQQLLGFSLRQEGWVLQTHHPTFVLRGEPYGPFANLEKSLTPTAGQEAWRAWCLPRGLPAEEVEACEVELTGLHLRICAPAPLLARLRASRSDALKGEAWLLLGAGMIRPAVRLEVVAAA